MFGALPGISAAAPAVAQTMQSMAPQKKKTGMFGSGGGSWAEALQAGLAGYLAAKGNPAGMAGLQMLNQRRQQAAEQEQYGQRREDEFQDFVRKEAFKSTLPQAERAPHYFEDNSGNQWAIGADGQPRMVHKDDLPFKLVPNGMGGVVPVDLRALMAGQGGAQAPVGKITPLDEGGPTLGGSGGFRSPRY